MAEAPTESNERAKAKDDLERQYLRDKPIMEELLASKAFKRYQEMVQVQIITRLNIAKVPLHMQGGNLDFSTRAAQAETIKGAIMGLELAYNLPQITIDQAKSVIASRGGEEK